MKALIWSSKNALNRAYVNGPLRTVSSSPAGFMLPAKKSAAILSPLIMHQQKSHPLESGLTN
ncbi:hypothetical protein AAH446_06770 [Erwinia sp. P6884]|uniref:hypothetical protein n=1 Tax=Erwinia sp. P6884 TaxID=3141450 RepID=UPI003199AF3C